MSLSHSPQIATAGLAFYYDMNNPQKSWRGKPTTNFIYTRNARDDATYASYSATASGTWNAKHPDAIRVYNDLGSEISAYSNTGVTDWTNTYHAIWTLDPILKRPVVTMRDYDGNWKAKSFGTGQTMTSMGLAVGSTYTISWLQWTDDIAKSTNAGLYGVNTSGVQGFHDGLSNSISTSYNTQPYTWQRVYATFTVSAVRNLSAGLTCYMYGHFIKRGTLRIADVQLEVGTPSGFSKAQIRTNTEAILDLTNNNVATANSLSYLTDGTFEFLPNDVSSTVSVPLSTALNKLQGTINMWVYPRSYSGSNGLFVNRDVATSNALDWLWIGSWSSGSIFYFRLGNGADCCSQDLTVSSWSSLCPANVWTNVCVTWSSGQFSRIYVNGQQAAARTITAIPNTNPSATGRIGLGHASGASGSWHGKIESTQIYNKALSAAEVQQNFNALRGRYGI